MEDGHREDEPAPVSAVRERDSKLELFESDPLVDAVGVRRMAGEHPMSPRDGDEMHVHRGSDRSMKVAKLGTLTGVYIPCVQNILGIIFYIRLSWIVGIAGIGQSLLLVALTCLSTVLTGLSLSAIATNGAMKGGGPYYLIGRALGPEVGVSIGLCFFLGNAVAGSLYILGAVETLLDWLPQMSLFPPEQVTFGVNSTTNSTVELASTADMQVYGVIVTVALCIVVLGGVRVVVRVGPLFLIPSILAIICIFIGIIVAPRSGSPEGLTGLSLSTLSSNWASDYQKTNANGIPDENGNFNWSFTQLLGLFYPAVTGIMAGSNRSASLKDTQKSIPIGTLWAIGTTTLLYVFAVFMFGSVALRDLLLTDRLLTATLAWPSPAVVYIGIILSTLGAAMQNLMSAPRLLTAIANDDILPILDWFKTEDNQEPYLATLCTLLICAGFVCIGDVDYVTPVITMFFLLCYLGVNLSCFLLDLLDAPSWRPRWKWHHTLTALAGAILCVTIMFMISWFFTLLCLLLAVLIYYYVSLKGKAGDWGDGFKSAYLQLALRSLKFLGASQVHPKNWYPIPLIFCKPWGILPPDMPCHPKLADFANCMKKKGRGMTIFATILEGRFRDRAEDARSASHLLLSYIDYKRCEGVAEAIVADSLNEGFRIAVQTMGLANLKPNIVCMRYPEIWREDIQRDIPGTFVNVINDCNTANKACVIVKGLDEWPGEYQKQYGTIDLYWIVRDGGIMLLLSQLLRAKESFENCKIQVFCIAEEDTGAENLKLDVSKFLYDLRMQADVIVVTMKAWEDVVSDAEGAEAELARQGAMEAFTRARRNIAQRMSEDPEAETHHSLLDESKVNKFLYTTIKLNSIILRYSRMAAVVLVSLPPPPQNHPPYCYMDADHLKTPLDWRGTMDLDAVDYGEDWRDDDVLKDRVERSTDDAEARVPHSARGVHGDQPTASSNQRTALVAPPSAMDCRNYDASAYAERVLRERKLAGSVIYAALLVPGDHVSMPAGELRDETHPKTLFPAASLPASPVPAHGQRGGGPWGEAGEGARRVGEAQPAAAVQAHKGAAFGLKTCAMGGQPLLFSCGDDGRVAGWRWSDLLSSNPAQAPQVAPCVDLVNPPTTWAAARGVAVVPETNAIDVDEQRNTIYSAAGNGCAYAWDVESQKRVAEFRGHSDYLHCVVARPQHHQIVTGSEDGTCRVWDCRTATTVLCLNPFTARQAPLSPSSSSSPASPWVSSIATDSTTPWLLCGTGGSTASLFSLQAPASALLRVSLGAPVHAVAMGRDADEILVAGASAVLTRLTFAGQLKSLTATAMPSIYSLHSHSPSQLVAVAGRGGTVDIITSIGSHLATFQCA
ncbi:unnamed protein product [Closterium sp. NIES-65]|nr:unnamed protein product [Closterium sp. NIES-65]